MGGEGVKCFTLVANARRVPPKGERIGHSDIAVACVLRFTREAHPHLFDAARTPALAAHAATCEALPAFAEIVQPLDPPKG
jgi:glutathione S-transferase